MSDPDASVEQGRRLLQAGMSVFLFGLLLGLAVQRFTVPRLGLSAHLLAILQGFFLMILGLLWPRLRLRRAVLNAAYWLAVFGSLAPIAATLLAAIWGAGNSILRMAAGSARGSALQETVINVGLRTGGASLIALSIVVLFGLRGGPVTNEGETHGHSER